jgi:hypothetical protein
VDELETDMSGVRSEYKECKSQSRKEVRKNAGLSSKSQAKGTETD